MYSKFISPISEVFTLQKGDVYHHADVHRIVCLVFKCANVKTVMSYVNMHVYHNGKFLLRQLGWVGLVDCKF